jgi:hypothetical protein
MWAPAMTCGSMAWGTTACGGTNESGVDDMGAHAGTCGGMACGTRTFGKTRDGAAPSVRAFPGGAIAGAAGVMGEDPDVSGSMNEDIRACDVGCRKTLG